MPPSADEPPVAIQTAQYDMDDIRRAREFYRYLQPNNLIQPHLRRRESTFDVQHEHVPSLSAALAPFCQLTALRCDAPKAMLNVMDRDVMYFLADSSRRKSIVGGEEVTEFVEDPIFMSCSSVPLKGRICEATIRMDTSGDEPKVPTFVISDLSQSEFSHLSVISGPPFYKFYAGVPITTRDDIHIGSLAIMDTVARPQGLTKAEETFLGNMAQQIMVYLETNRQAIEGRRSKRMSRGLESFLAGKKEITDDADAISERTQKRRKKTLYGFAMSTNDESQSATASSLQAKYRHSERTNSIVSLDSEVSTSELSTDGDDYKQLPNEVGESRTHLQTFTRAANLLRECMGDLGDDGSVCFQSLKPRFGSEVKSKNRRHDTTNHASASADGVRRLDAAHLSDLSNVTQILACSTSVDPFGQLKDSDTIKSAALSEAAMRDLMVRYPSGSLWSLEDTAQTSSEEDTKSGKPPHKLVTTHRVRKPSRRKQSELKILRAAFPSARQILFAPLWDATMGAFAHAVFVITSLETRSFSAASELNFLNSFCSTVMAECSRLDTMMADKQKSDFVGTISHEMRSPLHGILASVEFLSDTEMSEFQRSLIDTVDSCGRTLLDTINHVLDFSKVNSFQKQWQSANKKTSHGSRRNPYLGPENSSRSISHGAPPLLQLFGVTNISSVLEEVVDGLVLGQTYNSGIDLTDVSREARGRVAQNDGNRLDVPPSNPVSIVLDIEQGDWEFMTQPGAVRRIIMNITGNAMKYTSHGTINVYLKSKENEDTQTDGKTMVFTVTDTGKGISQEFLATKLFVPFAQENALAPGTGLGLSIVRSIVLMLGGTIDVSSTVGKGTTVQVTLPLKRPLPGQVSTQNTPQSGGTVGSGTSNTDESIVLLQRQAADATVAYYRRGVRSKDHQADALQRYVRDWYHLDFVDPALVESASVVIVDEADLEYLMEKAIGTPGRRPALVVLCSVASRHSATLVTSLEERISSPVEFLAKPCGPHKLARSLRLVLEKKRAINPRFPQVTNLGVIPEAVTPVPPTSGAAPTANGQDLHEMDLNAPGESDAFKVVQATEDFAASQASHLAQMAINEPSVSVSTPLAQVSEGGAFPFPMQVDESSRQRRESRRNTSATNVQPAVLVSTPATVSNAPPKHDTTSRPSPSVNPHILLVDDNKINLKLLETFLKSKRKYGYIEQAEDGQQAVNLVKNTPEAFDIIFMDVSMPVMNGFEATRAIRGHEDYHNIKPGAMVIALTGLASGRDQTEGFDSGCDIYMTKPVSFREVGKLLDNWEEHQKLNLAADIGKLDLGPTEQQ